MADLSLRFVVLEVRKDQGHLKELDLHYRNAMKVKGWPSSYFSLESGTIIIMRA